MLQPTTRSWALPGVRVLVVEDHEDTREMLGTLLETYGFEVELAEDAPTALALASEWRPHAVLVDLRLPGVTGAQLARALRRLDATRTVPIVACTGYTRHAAIDEALAAGCDGVMIKPFETDALIASLRTLLGRRDHDRDLARAADHPQA